jgi:hypothetical protein
MRPDRHRKIQGGDAVSVQSFDGIRRSYILGFQECPQCRETVFAAEAQRWCLAATFNTNGHAICAATNSKPLTR